MALNKNVIKTDFCIVGGGLAGMCAAIAAARQGIKVVLMHERPVLGGNASSEIRMWVCGASGDNNRETGIIEEISLENLYRNPLKNYSIWDSILYEKVRFEENISLLLNCSCYDAKMGKEKDEILSVAGWQMTTQTHIEVFAKHFADCSGDSILAPLTGAEFRVGRESKHEFNEKTSIEVADKKTMGMSCLIQARKTDYKTEFKAPTWAKKMTAKDIEFRRPNLESSSENYWYLELGGDRDSIADTESIRDELLALALGLWDYVKNSGEFDADLWQLDFLGFLPGKRESRRMVGEYIMTQNDVMSGGIFDDIVAFGGWPLDDHNPKGFYHEGHPNVWGKTPSPYGIPYRTLYSKNIKNLFFAGRNISMTHAAMSSARVMGTTALLGQAVGTAASIAIKEGIYPHGVYENHIENLKETLMENDCFLPHNIRKISDLAKNAKLCSSADIKSLDNLRNGCDRNNRLYELEENGVFCPLGDFIEYKFDKAENIRKIRLVFDSDLDRLTLPGDRCERTHSMRANINIDSPIMHMPKTLIKEYKIEYLDENDDWISLFNEKENKQRLILQKTGIYAKGLRFIPLKTWGDEDFAHVFSFDVE